ncbi:MAG: site-2 protease family protein [Oscillospiraceae bacterium]|nr:site-2 protease family protein [Oscillospiraceae bacterium]
MIDLDTIIPHLLTALAVIVAVMFHEISHGLAAYALGDKTAKEQGRLSLNPLRHIDWIGLLMFVTLGFGWAKPVQVDTRYFKNQRLGLAAVSFAGPVMNFLLAFVSIIAFEILLFFSASLGIMQFFLHLLQVNIVLGVFNLFPIPPLDGSKILGLILPEHIHMKILRYERYGMFVLIALLWIGVLRVPLNFLVDTVWDWYFMVGRWIYNLLR